MTADTAYCPNCGKQRQEGMRYCSSCGYDYGNAAAPASDATAATAVPGLSLRPASIAVIVGGALIALASFLPWVTAQTIFGSISRSGIDGGGDGVVTLIAGGLIVVLGLVTLRRPNRAANILIAVAAAVAAVIFAIDLSDVQGRVSDLEADSEGLALGGVGIGLWLVALGAVIAFVGSIMRRSWHKEPDA